MDRVGNGQGQDDRWRICRGRGEVDPQPASQSHTGDGGKTDNQKGGHHAGYGTETDHHDQEEHEIHDRHQGGDVVFCCLAKGIVDHYPTGEIDIKLGVFCLDFGDQGTARCGYFIGFVVTCFRFDNVDINAGYMAGG